jgi:hypothetical protein
LKLIIPSFNKIENFFQDPNTTQWIELMKALHKCSKSQIMLSIVTPYDKKKLKLLMMMAKLKPFPWIYDANPSLVSYSFSQGSKS